MPRRWSKFKKKLEALTDPRLNFRIHFLAYPMRSERGSTEIPRCYITIDGEIVWDFPKDFPQACTGPYAPGVASDGITLTLQRWIDTPGPQLTTEYFVEDEFGLHEILLAADRRLGKRRLAVLAEQTSNNAVKQLVFNRIAMSSIDAADP